MKYLLACGFTTLTLGGCVNENPFYVDPTGMSASMSGAGNSSMSVATSVDTADDTTADDTTADDTTADDTVDATSSSTGTTGMATMDTADDTGSTTMPAAFCGDGEENAGELCDDGNQNDVDGCTVACLPPPSLESLSPSGVSALLAHEGLTQTKGQCMGLQRGISIVAHPEMGIVRVKIICQDVEFTPIGDGVFEIKPTGALLYGEYIGTEGDAIDDWAPVCPANAPALVGIGGWAHDSDITKLELSCVKLLVVPEEGSYKLIQENLTTLTNGYDDWGNYQTPVDCGELPGDIPADIVVHASAYGVSGIHIDCATPDFGA